MLHIKLIKSPVGNNTRNRRTVAALGLHKMRQTVVHSDTPSIRGMIHHVKHLLEVVEGPAPEPKAAGIPAVTIISGPKAEPAKNANAKAAPKAKASEPAAEAAPAEAAAAEDAAAAKPKRTKKSAESES